MNLIHIIEYDVGQPTHPLQVKHHQLFWVFWDTQYSWVHLQKLRHFITLRNIKMLTSAKNCDAIKE